MAEPYTHKSLTEIKDYAPEFGYAAIGEARFTKDALGAEATGLSYHKMNPDQRSAFGHKHDEAEEIYVVIGGSGRMKLDDEIVEIAALDAIRVAPEVTRAFESGPEGLEVLAMGARHDGDGEMVQDWWPE